MKQSSLQDLGKLFTSIYSGSKGYYPLNAKNWVACLYDTDSLYDLCYILKFMAEKTSLLVFGKTKK